MNGSSKGTSGVVDLGAVITDVSDKQDKIDSSHKLSADLIEDGTTNKVINVKPDWNAASGNAAEILNKPTIPAAQVQSDWNATSGMGVILNKPTIPDVSNFVEKSQTTGLLKNDGTVDTNTYLTQHQDITGKEDRVSVGTISGTTLSASVNTYYVGSSVGTLAVTLPNISDTTHAATVAMNIVTGSSPNVTFAAASGVTISYAKDFELEASKEYEVNCLWNGAKWLIAAVEFGTS